MRRNLIRRDCRQKDESVYTRVEKGERVLISGRNLSLRLSFSCSRAARLFSVPVTARLKRTQARQKSAGPVEQAAFVIYEHRYEY